MREISLPLLTTMLHLTSESITYWKEVGDLEMVRKREQNYIEILTEIKRRKLNERR